MGNNILTFQNQPAGNIQPDSTQNRQAPLRQESEDSDDKQLQNRFEAEKEQQNRSMSFEINQNLSIEEQLSMHLEDIFQVSVNSTFSSERSYSLKNMAEELMCATLKKPLLTKSNISDVVFDVLQSPQSDFLPNHEDRVKYLLSSIRSLINYRNQVQISSEKIPFMSSQDYEDQIEMVFNYLITILTQFGVFGIEGLAEENEENLVDVQNPLLTVFFNSYDKYSVQVTEEILTRLEAHDDFRMIMHAFFKRIYCRIARCEVDSILDCVELLDKLTLLLKRVKILEYFLNESPLFSSDSITNGSDLQKKTIFGQILSITTFREEWANYPHLLLMDFQRGQQVMLEEFKKKLEVGKLGLFKVHEQLFKIIRNLLNERPEKVLAWIEKVILFNRDVVKMAYDRNRVSSVGFMFNFLLILLRFSSSLTQNAKQVESVIKSLDLSVILEKKGLFQQYDTISKCEENALIIDEAEVNATASQVVVNKEKIDLLSQLPSILFRNIMAAIHLNTRLLTIVRSERTKVAQLKRQNMNNQLGFGLDPISAELQLLSYEILLTDQRMNESLLKFFEFEILLAYSTNDQEITPQKDFRIQPDFSRRCTAKYASLPLFLAEDINQYSHLLIFDRLSSIDPSIIENNNQQLLSILEFNILIIGFKAWCSNHHFRVHILTQFSKIIHVNNAKGAAGNHLVTLLEKQSDFMKQQMIFAITNNFMLAERECFNSANLLEEKMVYRRSFNQLLQWQLRTNETFSFTNIDTYLQLQFINYFVEYPLQILELFMSKLIANYNLYKFSYSNSQNRDFIVDQSVIVLIDRLLESIQAITTVVKRNPDLFLQDEVKSKFTSFLIMTFTQFMSDSNLIALKRPVSKDFNLRFKGTVSWIVKLFLEFQNSEKFIASLIEDERALNIEEWVVAIENLEIESLVPRKEFEQFEVLSNRIKEEVKIHKANEDTLYADVPEKYLDPLLSSIMTDPVLIPKSGTIVDRISITRHLLIDKTDPFTRDPLEETDLVPLPELKLEIQEFIQRKLSEKHKCSASKMPQEDTTEVEETFEEKKHSEDNENKLEGELSSHSNEESKEQQMSQEKVEEQKKKEIIAEEEKPESQGNNNDTA